MVTGPSYLQFHVAFILPALAMLTVAAVVSRTRTPRRTVWSVGAGTMNATWNCRYEGPVTTPDHGAEPPSQF